MFRKFAVFGLVVLVASVAAEGATQQRYRKAKTKSRIDNLLLVKLKESNIQLSKLCSDEVFVRRVYLDILGILPKPSEVREFLPDNNPDKRSILIDQLLDRDG